MPTPWPRSCDFSQSSALDQETKLICDLSNEVLKATKQCLNIRFKAYRLPTDICGVDKSPFYRLMVSQSDKSGREESLGKAVILSVDGKAVIY